MRALNRLGSALAAVALTAATAAAFAGPASAATARDSFPGAGHAVFVQTDAAAGTRVVPSHRSGDGKLTWAHSYSTDGLGGTLTGSVVDHLASQGSLTYDPWHGLLYAVNAGSNTLSVFAVHGDRLSLRQVVSSGGTFPVSVAVHGDLVYAVNAENGGSVQGYRVFLGRLFPIAGSNRPLGLDPAATPQFTNTPGQVAFSPSGSQLIVTTKMNGSDIDVFAVHFSGRLSHRPVVNSVPGTVPFGITFDQAGHLVIADAGTNALATYSLSAHGAVTLLGRAGPRLPLRIQCRKRRRQPVFRRRQRQPHAARRDRHRCGNGRCLGVTRRALPVRPDRRQRARGRVPGRPGRLAHPDRVRDRCGRGRRRGHRRCLITR